jgi:type IV secretion system protein VirB4
MVCTEVFYFVDRSEVVPLFEEQDYILGISGDSELKEIKGITKIINSDQSDKKNHFCHQRISFMVMGEDLNELDKQIIHASEQLAKIGIVHFREDINLEKTFWAQLPGNFSFLSKMSPTILENTAALASLHNFPTGNQYNPWGRAVTLLRTEKGTPYFMNFHDQDSKANVCIYGARGSGKTTLLNFLLSEADKYNPSTILITNDLSSDIFVKSKGGKCLEIDKGIINPFICDDSEESRKFIFDFLKIIANHYIKPLSSEGLGLAQALSARLFDLPLSERKLTSLIATIKDSESGGLELLERLKVYNSGGAYHGVFEREEPLDFKEGETLSLNLEPYDDKAYTTNNYPKEKKLVEQFEYDLNTRRSLKAGVILALHYLLKQSGKGPKIFALDNMGKTLNLEFFGWLVNQLSTEIQYNNGVFVTTVNIDILQKLFEKSEKSQEWIRQVNTSIFLPPEIKITSLDKILGLDSAELSKLYDLVVSSRTFLIKQDGNAIASELSIGGLPGIIRILSAGEAERDIYQRIIKERGDKAPEDWVEHFYNAVDNV